VLELRLRRWQRDSPGIAGLPGLSVSKASPAIGEVEEAQLEPGIAGLPGLSVSKASPAIGESEEERF
jgi:hypothetical protein